MEGEVDGEVEGEDGRWRWPELNGDGARTTW